MPLAPLRPGDPAAVGPHRLLARLGQGGMGTVFLAVTPDERAVAVKVLRDAVVDGDARRRFRHELEALRRVRGPHLVEVVDADVEADVPYLATRFVPGRRLDELVAEEGPLEPGALRLLARGLADALATLHDAGVVHRDLTPGNVLVVDGSPQVIDLGLATAADLVALTRTGMLVGTPGYLAPEQVTGEEVTPAVDLHAWGATVAFAGTGRPPFGTGRPDAVLYRIVHEEPDLHGLPPDLLPLVEAAMHPDPERRPQAEDLLHRLGGASSEQTTALHLPRDVDATRLLGEHGLQRSATAVLTAPPSAYDEGVPWQEPERRRPGQLLLTSLAALAVVATASLVAPVLTAAAALLALVLLRAGARGSQRLELRREQRGGRRRDPVVTVLAAPWHLLAALVDTLVALPLVLLTAAVPAGAVWLLDPTVDGLERPELTAAAATVTGLVVALARRGSRRSRRALARALTTAAPTAGGAVAVGLALVVSAVLLLAAAEGAAPTWWPLPAAP